MTELEVAKAPDARIRRLFVDPLGLHALLTLQTGSQLETMYLDAGLKKARPLAKLRGVAVTSVAWSPVARARSFRCACREGRSARQQAPRARLHKRASAFTSAPVSERSEALVGTDSGVLLEVGVDEARKERVKQVYDLNDESGPIAGLLQVRLWGQARAARIQGCGRSRGPHLRLPLPPPPPLASP